MEHPANAIFFLPEGPLSLACDSPYHSRSSIHSPRNRYPSGGISASSSVENFGASDHFFSDGRYPRGGLRGHRSRPSSGPQLKGTPDCAPLQPGAVIFHRQITKEADPKRWSAVSEEFNFMGPSQIIDAEVNDLSR